MKDFAEKLYFKIVDFMHYPFVTRGTDDPFHAVFSEFISISKVEPSPAILEIGSRNVTGVTRRHLFPHCSEYVGFDVLAGDGVDIVGDAHKLSGSFSPDQFDFIYSV